MQQHAGGDTEITCTALAAAMNQADGTLHAVRPTLHPDEPLMRGRIQWRRFSSGLRLHTADTIDLRSVTTETLTGPGLTVVVFLEGRTDVLLGKRSVQVAADQSPYGLLLSKLEPERFVRHATLGASQRKVAVCLSPRVDR